MHVRRGHDIRTRLVDLRMDGECRVIEHAAARNHLAVAIDVKEVRYPDAVKSQPEGVDPESIQFDGVPRRNVPRHTFGEAEHGEDTKRRRQALLAMKALFPGIGQRPWCQLRKDRCEGASRGNLVPGDRRCVVHRCSPFAGVRCRPLSQVSQKAMPMS